MIRETNRVFSASRTIGTGVVNPANEDLGSIEDIVIDSSSGCIAYAVLSFGGILGIGDKWFAIPWKSLSFDPARKHFVLDVDKETLKKAPGFDKENWPDMADRDWGRRVHEHYGARPYWEYSI